VYNTVRGIDDEPVTARDKVKSINSCKSFEPTADLAVVRQWLEVLAAELADRMEEDSTDHQRHARSLGRCRASAKAGAAGIFES